MTHTDFSNVGIAVITYNRSSYLNKCLSSIYASNLSGAEVVVFYDRSTDDSFEIAESFGKAFRPPENGGVVRNKNRALLYFTEINPKEVILLVEDDVTIHDPNWISEWSNATLRHGHINYTAPGFDAPSVAMSFVSGSGTAEDPHIYKVVTGQCTGVKSEHIRNLAGYLDPSFNGYGYGHVEWTLRMIKKNIGGYYAENIPHFFSIKGGVLAAASPTFRNDEELSKNSKIFAEIAKRGFENYTPEPWLNEDEKQHHFTEAFGRKEMEKISLVPNLEHQNWRQLIVEELQFSSTSLDTNLPTDFDPEVYLSLHADVKKAGVDAATHYLTYGRNERRKYKK